MIRVIVRSKPVSNKRIKCIKKLSTKKIILESKNRDIEYNVDGYFEYIKNKHLYNLFYDVKLTRSNVLFAYGQSGSGKTHSIFGDSEEPGILTILCRNMYASFGVFYITCYEIYNNVMYDLLDKNNKLKFYSFSNYIDKRKRYIISDVGDYLNIIDLIIEKRKASATSLNDRSSRSHCVVEIMRGELRYTIIDLAGSEHKKYDKEITNVDKHERKSINKDLFAIKEILRTNNTKKIGNYHHSKIACVLKHAFRSAKTVNILCNVIPTKKYGYDTMDSLNYCCKIKSPKNETALIKYNPYEMENKKKNKKKKEKDEIQIPEGIKKSIKKNIRVNIRKKEYPPLLPPPKKCDTPNVPLPPPPSSPPPPPPTKLEETKVLKPILKIKVNEKLPIHIPINLKRKKKDEDNEISTDDEMPKLEVISNEEIKDENIINKYKCYRIGYDFTELKYIY